MRFEREVILGAMIFFGLAILVVGAAWLSESFWGPAGGYKLRVRFPSTQNVNKGTTKVTLRGVEVGKVLEVYMEGGQPIVLAGFRDLRNLPEDSEIVLRSFGMLGERVIEVRLGRSPSTLPDGAYVDGAAELGIEDLASDAAGAAGLLRAAIDSVVSVENIQRINRTIAQIDATTSDLRRLVEANREKLSSTIGDLSEAAAGANATVGASRQKVERSAANLERATEQISTSAGHVERATASFERTMGHLESIARKIDQGEGSLGRLVNDDGVVRRIEATVTTADSLIEAIKADPGHYLNFRVTLF